MDCSVIRFMESKIVCKCGKDAIGFTSDIGWVCSDCLDKRIKEPKLKKDDLLIKK